MKYFFASRPLVPTGGLQLAGVPGTWDLLLRSRCTAALVKCVEETWLLLLLAVRDRAGPYVVGGVQARLRQRSVSRRPVTPWVTHPGFPNNGKRARVFVLLWWWLLPIAAPACFLCTPDSSGHRALVSSTPLSSVMWVLVWSGAPLLLGGCCHGYLPCGLPAVYPFGVALCVDCRLATGLLLFLWCCGRCLPPVRSSPPSQFNA